MILGLSLSTYTLIHSVISLIALAAGIVVVIGLLGSKPMPGWTALYLVTAILTSAGGFAFPTDHLLPSQMVGAICLVLLLVVILARYAFRLAGAWRWIYAICLVLTVYFDAFVAIVQSFLKIPAVHALAPTQGEPPFAIAQGALLLIFAGLLVLSAIKFRPAAA